jgi:manganese/iron transport system substrate-binding protein
MHRPVNPRVRALLVLLAVLVAACGSSTTGSGAPSGGRLQVITTTTVFADLVAQVGGDKVDASSLVPKGGDVHTFDPTPADVRLISSAALLVRNGLGLDDWVTRLVSDAGTNATVVTLGEQLDGVQYITSASGQPNPHLWMNVGYAAKYVDRIEAALVAADPADAASFAANADAYKRKLAALDTSIRSRLAAVPAANRVVVSFHDAFPYFAAAYGLTVVGTIVDAPGQDPSAGQIADLVQKIRSSGAKAIFAEAQFNTALAKAIASETGASVVYDLYDDTLGDPPQDTYLGMMQWNADRVVAALGGS